MKTNRRNKPPESDDHWSLITTTGPDKCFVCEKKIKDNKGIYIGKHKNGDMLYRHKRCNSLSDNWANKFKKANNINNQGGHDHEG
jgi:hypothetical protein